AERDFPGSPTGSASRPGPGPRGRWSGTADLGGARGRGSLLWPVAESAHPAARGCSEPGESRTSGAVHPARHWRRRRGGLGGAGAGVSAVAGGGVVTSCCAGLLGAGGVSDVGRGVPVVTLPPPSRTPAGSASAPGAAALTPTNSRVVAVAAPASAADQPTRRL